MPAVIGFAVVGLNPAGPLQEYEVPPVAVKVVEPPVQISVFPVISQAGGGFTVSVLLHVLEHPFWVTVMV